VREIGFRPTTAQPTSGRNCNSDRQGLGRKSCWLIIIYEVIKKTGWSQVIEALGLVEVLGPLHVQSVFSMDINIFDVQCLAEEESRDPHNKLRMMFRELHNTTIQATDCPFNTFEKNIPGMCVYVFGDYFIYYYSVSFKGQLFLW
jgi:hypothetical protein